jgi:hypothetical protein
MTEQVMITEEWAKEIRCKHAGYIEETVDHYGQPMVVWFYMEDAGKQEGFPPYVSHYIVRDNQGGVPDLEDWEYYEILDNAYKLRTCATMRS